MVSVWRRGALDHRVWTIGRGDVEEDTDRARFAGHEITVARVDESGSGRAGGPITTKHSRAGRRIGRPEGEDNRRSIDGQGCARNEREASTASRRRIVEACSSFPATFPL